MKGFCFCLADMVLLSPLFIFLSVTKKESVNLEVLVEKCKKGDTQAFTGIYDELVKPIYRYIYYRVEPQIAEDLTEETFIKVWENLKQYKKGSNQFSAWVFRIAHNLVCDYYRKNEETVEIHDNIPDDKTAFHPKEQISVKLTKVQLRNLIKKLPMNYQEVIVLKYINDFDNPAIAKMIGKTEGAVRTLQFRALQQLRSFIGENAQDF